VIRNKKNFSLNVFEKASICRHFENEVFKRVANKEIEFPVYLSAGQEYAPATIAEIVSQKKIKPLIFGQHRGHSIYLSFGGNINKLIKELKGKRDGCTYGMGGSLSIHSPEINMYGHDGFMGSNACIGTGACFSSKKPTIVFIGDAALEEDYVLASLSWVSKKKLPILFIVDDNNYAVLTKKEERRDWEAKELAKAFKLNSFDMMDDPKKILKSIGKNLFKKPILINIHTQRLFWHAGAGKDQENIFDRHLQQKKFLGKKANFLDEKIKRKIKLLWEKN